MSVDDSEVFTETSVLMDLVLEGPDADCFDLFQFHSATTVTSRSVEVEFDRVCDRRHVLHKAVLACARSDDRSLDDFEPPENVDLSSNDIGYMVDLIHEMLELDREDEVKRRLNERKRRTDNGYENLFEDPNKMMEVFHASPDPTLMGYLKLCIDNEDDVRVVCDAVDWTENGGSGTFLSEDREDMIGSEDEINTQIQGYSRSATLDMYTSAGFLSESPP